MVYDQVKTRATVYFELWRTLKKLQKEQLGDHTTTGPVLTCQPETEQIEEMSLNRERTMKELANPDIGYQSLCVQIPNLPEGAASYALKSGLNQLLPRYQGPAGEDPHKHLMKLYMVCSTMRPADVPEELVKMNAFSFPLRDIDKDWLYLQPTPITT